MTAHAPDRVRRAAAGRPRLVRMLALHAVALALGAAGLALALDAHIGWGWPLVGLALAAGTANARCLARAARRRWAAEQISSSPPA